MGSGAMEALSGREGQSDQAGLPLRTSGWETLDPSLQPTAWVLLSRGRGAAVACSW